MRATFRVQSSLWLYAVVVRQVETTKSRKKPPVHEKEGKLPFRHVPNVPELSVVGRRSTIIINQDLKKMKQFGQYLRVLWPTYRRFGGVNFLASKLTNKEPD